MEAVRIEVEQVIDDIDAGCRRRERHDAEDDQAKGRQPELVGGDHGQEQQDVFDPLMWSHGANGFGRFVRRVEGRHLLGRVTCGGSACGSHNDCLIRNIPNRRVR